MAGGPLTLWDRGSMQILVLLSLGLQVVLFVFAGIRRREASPVLRLLLWLAYLLADSTAIYAVGHLSLSSTVREHHLSSFWAPFFLLHLGGPDNITAYALQNNQLWLRHLQTLIVQVLGAAYVLSKNISGGGSGNFLWLAYILMFALGVVKYGERTWALKWSPLESIAASIKTQPPGIHRHFHPHDRSTKEEFYLRLAHSLFHVCKRSMVDSSVVEEDSMDSLDSMDGLEECTSKLLQGVELWTLMEIELSLMYDILYTKAAVVHTFFGYLVRFLSPLTAAVCLVLFHLSSKDSHDRVDVSITYVLLGAAVFMETTSLLNALASSWTFAFLSTTRWRWLRYTVLCNERWDKLRRAVMWLHHLVKGGVASDSRYESRRWSSTIGQYNLLHFCTHPADTPLTSPLLGRLAMALAPDEWWNRKHYSGTIVMSNEIRYRISTYVSRLYMKEESNTGMLRKKWGEDPLENRGLYHKGVLKDSLGVEFQEGIIIWHIATEVFLAKSERAKAVDAVSNVHAIRVMSDYMMFLLVERPYMLPGQPQKRLYQRTCERLVTMRSVDPRYPSRARIKDLFRVRDGPDSSSSRVAEREELANNLYNEYENKEYGHLAPRLIHAARLAKELLEKERDVTTDYYLELVLDVWMDFLVYAGNKCSRESHAKKLNNGGELTTILFLMAEHIYQASHVKRDDAV